MQQLIAEATIADVSDLIAEAINLIVFIAKTKTGRKIKEIVEVISFDKKTEKYIVNKI